MRRGIRLSDTIISPYSSSFSPALIRYLSREKFRRPRSSSPLTEQRRLTPLFVYTRNKLTNKGCFAALNTHARPRIFLIPTCRSRESIRRLLIYYRRFTFLLFKVSRTMVTLFLAKVFGVCMLVYRFIYTHENILYARTALGTYDYRSTGSQLASFGENELSDFPRRPSNLDIFISFSFPYIFFCTSIYNMFIVEKYFSNSYTLLMLS